MAASVLAAHAAAMALRPDGNRNEPVAVGSEP